MEHLAHGEELSAFLVYVLLVDLVGQNHDVLFVAQTDHGLQVLSAHNLSGRVSRIDDHNGTRSEAIVFSSLDHCTHIVKVESPVSLFI